MKKSERNISQCILGLKNIFHEAGWKLLIYLQIHTY